jgi:phosphate transport system substrate-binding protein
VACRLTHTSCGWYAYRNDGTRRLLPTTDAYEPEKTLSLEHQRVLSRPPTNLHAVLSARTGHTGTHEGYTSLIARTAQLVLAAREPSADEVALAREKGVEIRTVPIALDAFVFIVNTRNPVRSITVEQIRDIYTGKARDWAALGGPMGTLVPYQRERNSGSQEAMEKMVMRGLEMVKAEPLERTLLMTGPYNAIRHDRSGIGYTFYYFDTVMAHMPEIAVLGINGVGPNANSIQDRSYPFVAEVYGAWLSDLPQDSPAAAIRDWLLTKDGQAVVAESGYVPIKR